MINKAKFLGYLYIFLGSLQLSWGFHAHRIINESAIYALPKDMLPFYKKHQVAIISKSVDADKRRYVDSAEAARHYIDIDRYPSISEIPASWTEAMQAFGQQTMQANGILPWHIQLMYQRLTTAFKEKKVYRIIQLSADIGHYIADAHVPLHTSSNYNGQYSNQLGIHALWESRIPEDYSAQYNLYVGNAYFIADSQQEIWQIIYESYALVDSVLAMERATVDLLPLFAQTAYSKRNTQLVYSYSTEFVAHYHTLLNGMVAQRMQLAARRIASFWLTAWVLAGQPAINP